MARRTLFWALLFVLLVPISGHGQTAKEQGPTQAAGDNREVTVAGPVAPDTGPASSHSREAAADGDEYWPPLYGYRLKVTDTLLTAFTFLLFLATLALWFATRGLVRSADRNAGLQLRAYVSVQSCRVEDYVVGKPVSIVVVVRNSGQTPSHATTIVAALKYRQKSDQEPLQLKPSGTNSRSSLASGAIETIKLISSTALTREQTMAIANGEARIIVHGEMRYVTVFGDPAVTHFKFYYDDACIRRDDKVLHVASDGNSAT